MKVIGEHLTLHFRTIICIPSAVYEDLHHHTSAEILVVVLSDNMLPHFGINLRSRIPQCVFEAVAVFGQIIIGIDRAFTTRIAAIQVP